MVNDSPTSLDKTTLLDQPKWLRDTEQEFDTALSELEGMYKQVSHEKDKFDPDFYSNKVLHAIVKKEQPCNNILLMINNEKIRIQKTIHDNQTVWEKKCLEFVTKVSENALLQSTLISNLILWKETNKKAHQDLENARKALQELKQKAINKKMDQQAIASEYLLLFQQFDYAVKFTEFDKETGFFNQCESKHADLPPLTLIENIPPYTELLKMSATELQVLADHTHNSKLVSEASDLAYAVSTHQKAQKNFLQKAPPELKVHDKSTHIKLIHTAQMLAKEYFDASIKLEKESRETYNQIKKEYDALLNTIQCISDPTYGTIHIARRSYNLAYNKMREMYQNKSENPNIRKNMVGTYHEFKNIHDSSVEACKIAREKRTEIMKKFTKASDKFGVYPAEKAYHNDLQMKIAIDELEQHIEIATKVIEKHKKRVKAHKDKILQDELLDLIKAAIENNVESFWKHQISCFGSDSSIKKQINSHSTQITKVPHGVAKIHFHLLSSDPEKFPSKNDLVKIKDTISLRTNARTGFFAKRSLTTTDIFYKSIAKLNINSLSRDILDQVRKELSAIKDSRGRKLDLTIKKPDNKQAQQLDIAMPIKKFVAT